MELFYITIIITQVSQEHLLYHRTSSHIISIIKNESLTRCSGANFFLKNYGVLVVAKLTHVALRALVSIANLSNILLLFRQLWLRDHIPVIRANLIREEILIIAENNLISLAVNAIMFFSVRRIDMIESLKPLR